MKQPRPRLLLLMLPLLAIIATAVPQAGATTRSAARAIDKSTPFGMVGNLAITVRSDEQRAMLDLVRESGAQWYREEFSWERIQRERGGPYLWQGQGGGFLNYDESVQRLHDAGLNILGLLVYNPAWFKGKNAPPDDWIGDWQLFVRNVVTRYGVQRGQIRHWEIWNEPNLAFYGYENGLYSIEDYARLLRATHEVIRAIDPEAVIVLGGLTNIWSEVPEHYYDTFDYLQRLGAAGAWPTFDVLSLHPYRPGAPEGSFQRRERMMNFGDEMRELDRLMETFGQKPIWFTEMSWSSHVGPYGVSEQDQAYYLVRMYAIALQYPNVEKIFWYNFRNSLAFWSAYDRLVFDETIPDWHMGLIRRTYPLKTDAPALRKPAFLAYRTMADLLGGLAMRERVAAGDRADLPSVYWFRYGKDQRGAELIWQLGSSSITVMVPCNCREARIRRWNGTLDRVVQPNNGTIALSVPRGGEPIYLEYGPDRQAGGRYFSETGHRLTGVFLQYWERNGGLAQFGYPISGELAEPDPATGRARIVQYFERNRFEYFPEHAGTSYVVQLGRLGEDQLRGLGIRWQDLPRAAATPPGCRRFTQTMRLLCPPFRAYWEQRGGLGLYGLPLTDAFVSNGRLVQYFERNRFEHHPENARTPYEVLLGLLGVELFTTR